MGTEACRSQSQPCHSFGGRLMQHSPQKKNKNILVYSVCSASKQQRRNDGFEFNIPNIMFSFITRAVTHGFIILLDHLFKKIGFK